MYLSWPHGTAVNDFVDSDRYVGQDFALTLPNINHIINMVKNLAETHIWLRLMSVVLLSMFPLTLKT